jgi:hypothetical protein
VREHEASHPFDERRTKRHICLEIATTFPDEMVADVRGAIGSRACFCTLACALDGSQAHAHLRLSGGIGQLLDGLAVAVATQEIHAPVHTGWIALQHALDEADGLELMTPVER